MKIILATIIILLLNILTGCEETVKDADLLYVEQLVINAPLTSGEKVNKITIMRTLPPLDDYDSARAMVIDADAKIISEGKEYRLIYQDGFYVNDILIPEVGKSYELQVHWKDKYAYANMTIPQPVEIDSLFYIITEDKTNIGWYSLTIYAILDKIKERYYRAVEQLLDSKGDCIYSTIDYYLYSEADAYGNNKIYVQLPAGGYDTVSTNLVDNFNKISDHMKFGIFVYDKIYYDYYQSRWRGKSSDDVFGSSGENVRWNIKGDGIGLFYGKSVKYCKIELK